MMNVSTITFDQSKTRQPSEMTRMYQEMSALWRDKNIFRETDGRLMTFDDIYSKKEVE